MNSKIIAALAAAFIIPAQSHAQDKFEVHGKADFVSNYVWRGFDQNSGFSVQPSLSLSYKGFSLSAWGSESLTNSDGAKEFDVNLSYTYKGLSITASDLWWGGKHTSYGYYEGKSGNINNGHHLEVSAAYNFGESFPLTLSWSTWLAGGDASDNNGDRCYSTYINASYSFSCPLDITLTPAVGFTPWNGYYSQSSGTCKACFTDISLKASKDIQITDKFAIPVYVQAIVNPTSNVDNTFLIAGLSLGF